MRLTRLLLIYLAVVFVGGGLLAPWIYWLVQDLAAHWQTFSGLASNPFGRFVHRAFIGLALIGLWPLLRASHMPHAADLGLRGSNRWIRNVLYGFLLGFVSMALVGGLAMACGGRAFNPEHTAAQMIGHFFSAAFAALIVSILEEIIFRGGLFGLLRREMAWPGALAISSLVYALVHFIQKPSPPAVITWTSGLELLPKMFSGGPPLLPALLTLFAAGSILALAYQRTGTLFLSMGLHAGWIFWLKSYGFFTVPTTSSTVALWGSDKLIDGWLPLPILAGVFWIVCQINPVKPGLAANK